MYLCSALQIIFLNIYPLSLLDSENLLKLGLLGGELDTKFRSAKVVCWLKLDVCTEVTLPLEKNLLLALITGLRGGDLPPFCWPRKRGVIWGLLGGELWLLNLAAIKGLWEGDFSRLAGTRSRAAAISGLSGGVAAVRMVPRGARVFVCDGDSLHGGETVLPRELDL